MAGFSLTGHLNKGWGGWFLLQILGDDGMGIDSRFCGEEITGPDCGGLRKITL